MSRELLPSLAPLVSRVRTDVTAKKTPQGAMMWAKTEALTEARLIEHLSGGSARGVCPIKEGESTTRVGLFDLDSHKGATPWAEMVAHADAIRGEARLLFDLNLVPFRSSGGNGIHLYAVWDEPQDAHSVREALTAVLKRAGYENGTKGVAAGEVEVFPKQDRVPIGGYGNQFILPLAGKSVPLEPMLDYEDAPRDHEMDWTPSAPVPVVEKPVRESKAITTADTPEALQRIRSALAAVPNDGEGLGYDEWRDIVYAIHSGTDGSDEGYALALEFSQRSEKFEDEDELELKVWGPADSGRQGGVTVDTLFFRARQAGWNDVTAEDFQPIEEPPVAEGQEVEPTCVLDPTNTVALARAILRNVHTVEGREALLRTNGLWYAHGETCWTEVPDDEVRAGAWMFLDRAKKEVARKVPGEGGKKQTVTSIEPFKPTIAQVGASVDALKAVAGVRGLAPPAWLPGYTGPAPGELVALKDGLLHIPTRTLHKHTPGFFSLNSLPYGWGEDETPVEWLKFLEAVWPGDTEAQQTLQEVFGYLLTADTSQQKMFLIRGPKRSGKGTIARVLGALVGRENMVSPTLTSLTSNFGLQPLIGKLVAMIPDARVGGQTNTQAVVEKLLMLSGEDSMTIDRKNKDAWTGTLAARVVIMTNETPQLGDASGALAGRFINISMSQSFYGREDLGLGGRILKELPGIFRWALDGRDRLKARGYFVQPASADADAEALAEANSPVTVFFDDVMEFGPDHTVAIADAYEAWRTWCGQNGRTHVGTLQTFGGMVRTAFPRIGDYRPLENGVRVRKFAAVRIKPHVQAQMGLFQSA